MKTDVDALSTGCRTALDEAPFDAELAMAISPGRGDLTRSTPPRPTVGVTR